jgi:hypothetical protein
MDFFLHHVTGLIGFKNFVDAAFNSLWNLVFGSGLDLAATVAATMQIIIMIVFNFFAGFIFILFSALFIMRYIMLWILVILSPIAFVSYILPITRRGQSLLSWRKWWEQLVAWAIIGIIAAFFLYLGFTMIAMINANPREFVCLPGDKDCGSGGLGLMNNILPYLIPLALLWIAYRETKRTSAMFAGEIISATEKLTKGAVTAATMATVGLIAAPALKGVEAGARKRLERVPVVGKALGGPGAYEAEQKKKTEIEKKKLEGRSADDLQKIVETQPITMADRHRRAAAMEILAEKRRLKNDYKKYLGEVKSYGGDTSEILKARPDWAPEVKKTPGEIIEKMDPGEFRRKIQAEALESPEVFTNMDVKQLREIERRGTAAQKDAIRTLLATKKPEINKLRRELKAQGKMVEYRRTLETINEAMKFPAFYEKPKARKAKPSPPTPPYVV